MPEEKRRCKECETDLSARSHIDCVWSQGTRGKIPGSGEAYFCNWICVYNWLSKSAPDPLDQFPEPI